MLIHRFCTLVKKHWVEFFFVEQTWKKIMISLQLSAQTCKDSRECSSLYCRAEKCTKCELFDLVISVLSYLLRDPVSRSCLTSQIIFSVIIPVGDVPEEKGCKNPCIPNPCFLGEPCVLQEVQCSRVYCLPIARCLGDSFW